jgi:hypothetical protein
MHRIVLSFLLLLGAMPASLLAQAANEPAQFTFNKNDVVAIYGNGLADRMQHDAWVETVLQSRLKGLDVSFRNLSFSGDTVTKTPRNEGFINDEQYVALVKPNVIFMSR